VDNPREVGADRIVNAVAAHATYGGQLIVIDFGTATTFDVVDAAGDYCGGCISPGINLSMEALHMATALLPRLQVRNPGQAPVIGTTTVAQMTSGVFWGYIGLIEGLVSRIKAERGGEMTVVATGGLAPLFAKATPVIQHIDPDLTLRGLLLIHQRNP
jgi:type III pantothenate kinase